MLKRVNPIPRPRFGKPRALARYAAAFALLGVGVAFGQQSRLGIAASEGASNPTSTRDAELREQIEQDGRLDSRELDLLVAMLAEEDGRVAEWLASAGESGLPAEAAPPWLGSPASDWRVANPLLLHAARAAAIEQRYEAALRWLALREANLGRPATASPIDGAAIAFYYEAIANQQLVRLEAATAASEALLALPEAETARRHRRIGQLVLLGSKGVDEASLGYVAKLMGDSRRRLSLGRFGEEERELQQDIVDRLDKVIDKLEEEQKKQNEQQQSGGGSPSGGADPMEQSRPAELKAAGDVEGRDVPPSGDWGSLPPAERERVTQQIIRDFPGHYRSLIEEYFRSLADPDRAEGEGRGANGAGPRAAAGPNSGAAER